MVLRTRQNFQVFKQIHWFFEIHGVLSNFKYQILHYLISIIKS